jgi:hypothetical protein
MKASATRFASPVTNPNTRGFMKNLNTPSGLTRFFSLRVGLVALILMIGAGFTLAATWNGFGLFSSAKVSAASSKSSNATGARQEFAIGTCDTGMNVDVEATGGTAQTGYATLNAAFAAINAGTHTGTINVEICASTTEGATPATLNSSGAGSASYTAVNIYPLVDAATISGTPATGFGVIQLNGADNVTINGDNPNSAGINRNLTMQSTSAATTAFTSLVRIALAATIVTSADNDTVKNLNLIGNATGRNIAGATSTTGSENTTYGVIATGGASTVAATTAPAALASVTTTIGAGATAANLLIDNNSVATVGRGIAVQGAATTVFPGMVISNNTIGNPVLAAVDQVYSVGITAQGSANGSIAGNTVYIESFIPSSTSAANRAIDVGSISATGTFTIERNKVNRATNNAPDFWLAHGINLQGGNNHIVRNNFVSNITLNTTSGGFFSTTFTAVGIRVAAGTGHQIYHNSVNMNGTIVGATPTLNAAFMITATTLTGIDARNNIFVNTQTNGSATSAFVSVALPSGATSAMNLTLNNNDYWNGAAPTATQGVGQSGTTSGTGFFTQANFDPTATTPATNFRSYTSTLSAAGTNDNASKKLDPQFVSGTDLHIAVASPMVDMGATVGVSNDIDGQLRVPPPDIGADEPSGITPPANDIAATAIVTPAPNSSVPTTAAVSPQASFTNVGTATQTNVQVRFMITGPGGYTYSDTKVIASINPNQTVVVTFALSSVFTTPGTYTSTAQVLTPDANTANDSVMATFTAVAPVSGSVNVGTGQTFTSLTNTGGIFDALNAAGASSNVTINITSDLSGETGTVALNELAGGFTVTIKPTGAARTITGSSTVGIIRINGADGVTIDGSLTGGSATGVGGDAALRNLTVQNTNATATAGAVIVIQQGSNSANNDTVKNVIVSGQDPTQTLVALHIGGNTVGTSPLGTANTNIVVDNCSFLKAILGIFNNGVSAAVPGTGMQITHNDLSATGTSRLRRAGIFFFAQNGIQVTDNKIGGIADDESADAIGIIAGLQNVTTTTVASGGVYNATISRNKIDVITSVSTVGFSAAGIAIAGDPLGPNTISNNMITGVKAPSTAPDITAGIFVAGVLNSNTKVYHNSVSMTGDRGAVASQIGSYGIAISGTDPIVDLRDNIFYTTQTSGGGANAKSYVLGMQTTTFVNLTSNFNDFFFGGANAAGFRTGSLDAAGTDLATLAAWQTATTKDANSLSVDPLFVDPVSDLHLQLTSPMKNVGTNVGVTVDFDNQTRDAMPDIGADEIVAGTLALSSATYSVGEAAGNLTVTVNRTGGTNGAVAVNYSLTDGTATGGAACGAGVDYVNTGGTVNFADGQATQTFMVPICNDAVFEGNETFNITLSGATGGATIGSPASAVATIVDDEVAMPGTVQFNSATYTVAENAAGGTATITVTRTGGSDGAVAVNYATVAGGTATGGASCGAGVDYVNASGTLNWTNGDSAPKTFTITICNDTLDEPDETVNLALSNATGGATIGTQGTAVLTITDDDATPSIAIASPSPQAEGNVGTTPFVFNVNLSAASGQTVTVHYSTADGTATAPSDYTAIPDTVLTFTPGQTNKQITVLVNGDTNFEGNETFFVNLSMPVNATLQTAQGTGTILNDDAAAGTVTINDVRTLEGNSGSHNVTFTATLTTPSAPPANASVQYATGGGTATPGASPPADYQAASGTLFFGAATEAEGGTDGNPVITTRTFTVTIFGDTNKEANETFFVTLSNPVGLNIGDGTGVGIIVDDDSARVSNFDGDLTSDLAVFRPSSNVSGANPNDSYWYVLQSTNGLTKYEHFGTNGDQIVPGDYDGDTKTDYAVFRPSTGTWYIENSSNFTFRAQAWGASGDLRVQGDYDGDGKTDIAVFRPSNGTWYVLLSSEGSLMAVPFGAQGDRPVQGDYDGDARTDIAVFRPSTGTWYVLSSRDGTVHTTNWGNANDKPVVGDFDGDGMADYTVFRPSNGTWYILQSLTGTIRTQAWGTAEDIPVPADYDGDGTHDIAVWRPSTGDWHILKSADVLSRPDAVDYVPEQRHFGQNGDDPAPDGYHP